MSKRTKVADVERLADKILAVSLRHVRFGIRHAHDGAGIPLRTAARYLEKWHRLGVILRQDDFGARGAIAYRMPWENPWDLYLESGITLRRLAEVWSQDQAADPAGRSEMVNYLLRFNPLVWHTTRGQPFDARCYESDFPAIFSEINRAESVGFARVVAGVLATDDTASLVAAIISDEARNRNTAPQSLDYGEVAT